MIVNSLNRSQQQKPAFGIRIGMTAEGVDSARKVGGDFIDGLKTAILLHNTNGRIHELYPGDAHILDIKQNTFASDFSKGLNNGVDTSRQDSLSYAVKVIDAARQPKTLTVTLEKGLDRFKKFVDGIHKQLGGDWMNG